MVLSTRGSAFEIISEEISFVKDTAAKQKHEKMTRFNRPAVHPPSFEARLREIHLES